MVKRSISQQRYIVAGVITALIFALGLLLGLVIDYERVQAVEERYFEQELDYRSLQLQFSFLDVASQDMQSCAAFEKAMESAVAELGDSLEKVQQYEEYSTTQKKNFEMIERRYILDNIRYWILVEEAKAICPMDRLSILYFYSGDSCDSCPDQGVILTYFKKKYGDDLLVFPIDTDIAKDEPIIDVARSRFNVTAYPSIVVGDYTFTGVVSKEKLAPIICQELKGEDC